MNKFAVIIPDRGDRPEFLQHCKNQIEALVLKPHHCFIVNYAPQSDDFDLVPRIKVGIEHCKSLGIDLVFIIENDDFYPPDYFVKFQPHFEHHEFFGDEFTTYYNLKNKTHNTWHHPGRSSLFTTGFKISALNDFKWPADNELFLDIKLWRYAKNFRRKFVKTGAIGMKHGVGKTGGKGHFMRYKKVDIDLKFLKARCNGSLEFYLNAMKGL